MMYYYLPEPPYFLIVIGLFVALTSGAAFEATLRQRVQEWSKNRSTRYLAEIQGIPLALPFLGMAVGICLFLDGGLEAFFLPAWLSYGLSISLTLFIGSLVWSQLRALLVQLERGGSKAIDLDALE
ncbi:MAG: hypothetical protein F6K47_00155 [Symploca sp. SIO2E6]|nr:hypothetical protein [Symploca sp. SIO2E6]